MSLIIQSSHLVYFFVVGVPVYWLLWILYARFLHPLRNVPGPFLASISRMWYVRNTARGNMDQIQRALHKQYGPLVRISPNEVACADPQAIKTIYPTTNPLTKAEFYPAWKIQTFSAHADNFSQSDEKIHSRRRRIVQNVYSLSSVLQCEPHIDRCSRLFVKKLGEIADDAGKLDLGEWLQWHSFDVIGELYFGNMFGFMEHAHDHESYIQSIDQLLPLIVNSANSPTYMRPFILGSAMFNSSVRKALRAERHIAKAAEACVATCIDQMKCGSSQRSGRTILQQLLEIVKDRGEKVDFGIHEVELEAYVGLFAGSETTAIALRAVFYYLLKHPQIYRQLQEEVEHADRTGKLSEMVQYAEAIRLPFLCACIKEAMRLHPSVGLTMPRFAPADGIEIAGMYIPKGYTVGMNAAVVHYDEGIFGKDADQFRPARWLEDDTSAMEKTLLTFGAGTRTCIGKNISISEIHKVVPQVIRHFEFELISDEPWQTNAIWFNKQTGVDVHIKRKKRG